MSRTVVDLTSSSPSGELQPSNSFPWEDGQAVPQSSRTHHTSKLRRLNHSSVGPSSAPLSSAYPPAPARAQPFDINRHVDVDDVEAVDLTGNDKAQMSQTVSKQQEDAVKAQQQRMTESKESRSMLAAYKCPVCMDTPVDATSTVCGK